MDRSINALRTVFFTVFVSFAAIPSIAEPTSDPRTDLYGDPLPPGAVARMGTVRLRHQGIVDSLAFFPDGRLVTVYGSLHVWEIPSGRELHALRSTHLNSLCVALSPDGEVVAVTDKERGARLWRTASWQELPPLEGPREQAHGLAFSPDGKILALFCRETTMLQEVSSRKTVLMIPVGDKQGGFYHALAFSPDGRMLACGSYSHAVCLWDVVSGKALRGLEGHGGSVSAVGFSADGTQVTSAGADASLCRWELATAKLLSARRDLNLGGALEWQGAFALSPDVACAAVGGFLHIPPFANAITVWDLDSGARRESIRGSPPISLVFSPDGKMLAGARRGSGVQFWSRGLGKELFAVEGVGREVAFSSDGKMVAFSQASSSEVSVWEMASGKEAAVLNLKGHGGRLAFSPDGKVLVVVQGEGLCFLEIASGRELSRLREGCEGIASLAFSPDGKVLVTGMEDTTVLVWDAAVPARAPIAEKLIPSDLEKRWADLQEADASRGCRAVWDLVSRPAQAVPFLAERLQAVTADDKKRVERIPRLIAALDQDDPGKRDRAFQELEAFGPPLRPEILQAIKGRPPVDVQKQLEELLESMESPRLKYPEALRAARAVQALEGIGSDEARRALAKLAQGASSARLTQDAAAALARLERRESGRRSLK